jgi:hypothetical protein
MRKTAPCSRTLPGGVPEQSIGDGKGTVYQVLQDRPGGVAVIDGKTMKVTATYPLGEHGSCNGLALDVKNQVLFAACAAVGPAPGARSRRAACAGRHRLPRLTRTPSRHRRSSS